MLHHGSSCTSAGVMTYCAVVASHYIQLFTSRDSVVNDVIARRAVRIELLLHLNSVEYRIEYSSTQLTPELNVPHSSLYYNNGSK